MDSNSLFGPFARMSLEAQSFIPILLEKVFQKYINIFEKIQEKRIVPPFHPRRVDANLRQFFCELKILLSEKVVTSAVRLLDKQRITIYKAENIERMFVEITEGRRSQRRLYLFLHVNYCTCANFQSEVLGIKGETLIHAKQQRFTCEHILALRLAQILQAPCLQTKTLPEDRFNWEFNKIWPAF